MLSILSESSYDLEAGSSSEALGDLFVSNLGNCAISSGLVFESSDDDLTGCLANLSGGLGSLPDNASLVVLFESSHDLGSFHDSSPDAAGFLHVTNLRDLALLETSLECLDDLWCSESDGSLALGASSPLSSSKSSSNTAGITLSEFLDDLSSLWNLDDGFGLTLGGESVSTLIGFTDKLTLLFSLDKFSCSPSLNVAKHGGAQQAQKHR